MNKFSFKKFFFILPLAFVAFALQSSYIKNKNRYFGKISSIYNPTVTKNPPNVQYGLYKNEKYSFERIYPLTLLENEQSMDGDGITLVSKDGEVDLKIYGSINASISNFQELFLQGQENLKLINKKFTPNYFYVSGTITINNVNYIKYIQNQVVYTTDTNGNDIQYLIIMQITYPQSQKGIYGQYCKLLQTKYLN